MQKFISFLIVTFGLASLLNSQAISKSYPPAGGTGGGYNLIQDEGTGLAVQTTLNFTGAGVSCADGGTKTNCTISGGSGSVNVAEVSITVSDFGLYSTTVTGQTWVTGTSKILCTPFGTTADGGTVELAAIADLQPTVGNLVAGTGFDLFVNNINGASGTFRFHCTGA
jgi:hypothetical protein